MEWFRRDLEDFSEKDWNFDDRKFSPIIVNGFPEPWKHKTHNDKVYLFPVSFCQIFADRHQMNNIARTEADYIDSLRESIRISGLFNPALMKYDNNGKLRYHDGYHRLVAVSSLKGFDYMPVYIEKSPRVKGFGRAFNEEILNLLNIIDRNKNV